MNPVSGKHRWECVLFVLLLLVQQNAFLSIPMFVTGFSNGEMRGVENLYNTVGVGLSLLIVALIVTHERASLLRIAKQNPAVLAFMLIILLSITWSLHPQITARRAVGYVITLAIAALLPLRFGVDGMMKVLSASFVVSALSSIAFVVAFPQYGIMHIADLEGCWQGVFSTKELLGSVMAVAVFVETYNLLRSSFREWWRIGLLGLYATLLTFAGSITADCAAAFYLMGAVTYLIWRRWQWRGLVAAAMTAGVLPLAFLLFTREPQAVLGLVGKDTTLTGRVFLWQEVVKLIGQKSVLGWGFRAMWQPGDTLTGSLDSYAGFEAPGAHNAVLEVALGVGLIGVLAMAWNVLVALRRGVACCLEGAGLLGWFTLLFVVGVAVSGITNEVMGMNQEIDWLVFNALMIGCGIVLQMPASTARVHI